RGERRGDAGRADRRPRRAERARARALRGGRRPRRRRSLARVDRPPRGAEPLLRSAHVFCGRRARRAAPPPPPGALRGAAMRPFYFQEAPGRRLAAVRVLVFGFALGWLVGYAKVVLSVLAFPAHRFAPIGVVSLLEAPLPKP